jgi:hypothetical protein
MQRDPRPNDNEDDTLPPDQGSTSGTTPDEDFVGRIQGTDVGYAEKTGGERRAEVEGS